jgi:hypothetical protein
MMDQTRARATCYRVVAEMLRHHASLGAPEVVLEVALRFADTTGMVVKLGELSPREQLRRDVLGELHTMFEAIAQELIMEAEKRELWIKQAFEEGVR